MLERMSSRHLTEWGQLFQIKAEEVDVDDDGTGRVGLFDPEGRALLGMGELAEDDIDDQDDEDGEDDDD